MSRLHRTADAPGARMKEYASMNGWKYASAALAALALEGAAVASAQGPSPTVKASGGSAAQAAGPKANVRKSGRTLRPAANARRGSVEWRNSATVPSGAADPAFNVYSSVQSGGYTGVALPPGRLGALGRRTVSLETERADPWEAILNLLRGAQVNYIIGGEARGGRKITARFVNVPLEEALNALADASGLRYHARGNIIVLTSPENLATLGMFRNPATPPGMSQNHNPFGGYEETAPPEPPKPGDISVPEVLTEPPLKAPQPRASAAPEKRLGTDVFIEVVTLRHIKTGTIMDLLSKLPRDPDLHSVSPDDRRNALVVSGSRRAIGQIIEIVRLMDVPLTQVHFKVHLFEEAGELPKTWPRENAVKYLDGKYGLLGSKKVPMQVIVLEGKDQLPTIIEKVKASGGKLSASPSILTLNNVSAKIALNDMKTWGDVKTARTAEKPSPQVEIMMTPSLNEDRSLQLAFSFGGSLIMNTLDNVKITPSDIAAEQGLQPTLLHQPNALSGVVRRVQPGSILAFLGERDTPKGEKPAGNYLLLVAASLLDPKPTAVPAAPPKAATPAAPPLY